MPFPPGHVIAGKYRIERWLGEGGVGVVYEAVNERLQKRVALKVLSSDVASIPSIAERFLREAIAASRAPHPGIVEIFDSDSEDGVAWIAMELLQGQTLRQRLEGGPVERGPLLSQLADAAEAIAAAHEAGIIHRDLKPENIFLCRLPGGGERIKILDFGLARVDDLERLTRTGAILGTFHYLAPEQLRSSADVDGRADIYALGAILFELLTGAAPHADQDIHARLAAIDEGVGPQIDPDVAGAPPRLCKLVSRCLAVTPAARPATMRELAAELRAALDEGMAAAPVRVATTAAPLSPPAQPQVLPATAIQPAHPHATAHRAPTHSGGRGGTWLLIAAGLAVGIAAAATAAVLIDLPGPEPDEPSTPPQRQPAEAPAQPMPVTPLAAEEPVPADGVPPPVAGEAPGRGHSSRPARQRRDEARDVSAPAVESGDQVVGDDSDTPEAQLPLRVSEQQKANVMSRLRPVLRRCADRSGSAHVFVTFNQTGLVTNAQVRAVDTPTDGHVQACMEAAARALVFPPSRWPLDSTDDVVLF